MITIKGDYWTYKPKLIPEFVFEPLLTIMTDYCQNGTNSKRKSCVFNGIQDPNLPEFKYGSLPAYKWSDAPSILHEICKFVEDYTQEKYDYVLVHIYESGNSSIFWHNDSEALNSSIASVSLGATRKFRLKKIGRNKGWDHELKLHNGDLVWMHGPTPTKPSCQNIYLHTVPVEKTVKTPRINLTFRQYK